jgi:hypothetical protein
MGCCLARTTLWSREVCLQQWWQKSSYGSSSKSWNKGEDDTSSVEQHEPIVYFFFCRLQKKHGKKNMMMESSGEETYVNTQQLAHVVDVFPDELSDELDTPSKAFLDAFRLRTGEAVYATKSQDAGIETLDIREVKIVTYWSKDMNAVTERFCSEKKDEKVCNSHPLCQFNTDNGECTENQLKVIVKYVFTQLDNMYNYLTDEKNTTFDDDWNRIVDCWLWNGSIKTDIEDDYEKLEGIMTEVAKEEDYDLPDAYRNLLRSAYEIVQNMPPFEDDNNKPSDEYLLAKVLNIEQDELFDLPEDDGIWDVDRGDVVIVKSDGNKYRAISNPENSQFQAMKLFYTGIVQAKIEEDTSDSKKRKASAQGGRSTNV